jgi:hypothetical protein
MVEEDDIEQTKKEMYAVDERPKSRLQSVLVIWLRRTIIALLIFILLVVIAWLVFVGPRAAEISRLQNDLAAAESEIRALEVQNASLLSLKAQRSILSLLVDANTARFELAQGEKEAATAALVNTGNTLYQLSLELGEEYDEVITSLDTRLDLAQESISSENDLSSLNDLEVFISTLQNLLQGLLSK